jgi:hypothetical protein
MEREEVGEGVVGEGSSREYSTLELDGLRRERKEAGLMVRMAEIVE